MKKNIWTSFQIVWLILAMFTAHNSIMALTAGPDWCAGLPCLADADCVAPCHCNTLDFMCYDSTQSER